MGTVYLIARQLNILSPKFPKKNNRNYYLLCAVVRDGSRLELLPRFWSFDEAVFIEQQAEK